MISHIPVPYFGNNILMIEETVYRKCNQNVMILMRSLDVPCLENGNAYAKLVLMIKDVFICPRHFLIVLVP